MSARLQRHKYPAGQSAGGEAVLMAGNMAHTTRTGDLHPTQAMPPVEQVLIDALRRVFPTQLREDFDLRSYDRQLGALKVIEFLQSIHDLQNNTKP